MQRTMYRRWARLALPVLFLVLCLPVRGFANESSVTIEAPEQAQKGEEVTIWVNVRHQGNNFIHYTEWVYVSVNGKEIKRWEFSAFDRPEAENFSREISYRVEGPLKIVAEASCSLHGSAGQAERDVAVK